MIKKESILRSFIFFVVFIVQTKAVLAQKSEFTNQSLKAQIGVGGGSSVVPQPQPIEAQIGEHFSFPIPINQTIPTEFQKYIDPNIESEFNKYPEVPVIVKVRDTSRISISLKDTIEEQSVKDTRRKEFLQNKTNFVLSSISQSEFKLKRKLQSGRGFS